MSAESLTESFEPDYGISDEVSNTLVNTDPNVHHLDARRRLEDKIEQLRLRKELLEFDFSDRLIK